MAIANSGEKLICMVAMALGVTIFAYIMGAVTRVLDTLNTSDAQVRAGSMAVAVTHLPLVGPAAAGGRAGACPITGQAGPSCQHAQRASRSPMHPCCLPPGLVPPAPLLATAFTAPTRLAAPPPCLTASPTSPPAPIATCSCRSS